MKFRFESHVGTKEILVKVPSLFSSSAATAVLAALVFLPFQSAKGQILYGGMVGNVTDSTGAVVPDAKVTINHAETGTTREATTNETGTYRFATIPPGMYTLTIQAIGFRAFSRSGVEVTV